ncbi:MAG: hypothetical protein HRU19_25240 [Pseudobacteriovorax sp.]|nr:hypothetical protein [Pseudobacteriovorax sp.]
MELSFEHNYQLKFLEMSFPEQTIIKSTDDVMQWRQAWLAGLSSWHSPYKAIVNCENLTIVKGEDESVEKALSRMETLLKGFFLKKAVVFNADDETAQMLPFESAGDRDAAFTLAKLKAVKAAKPGDFRSSIQIQNHFRQHVMEISFSEPVSLDSNEKLDILKSKITNNLMQWHSAWNILLDCSNFEIPEDQHANFERLLTFMRGFFLKETLGYSPKSKESRYPFKVYRSRHNAAGRLENEGNIMGDEANCQSRK